MRLFIAIDFDEKTKQNILAVQRRLRELGRGNFSRPENLHLTLVFLGEIVPSKLAAVLEAMDRTTVPPMSLAFDQVGSFRRDGGDLWWVGLRENKDLFLLQRELSGYLTAAGFRLENRRFSPHVTLARQLRLSAQLDPKALLGSPFTTLVDSIRLMSSERVGGKLTYTEQYRKKSDPSG